MAKSSENPRHYKLVTRACFLLFILAMLALYGQVDLYRATFISPFISAGIMIVAGLLFTLLLRKRLAPYFATRSFPLHLLYHSLTAGSFVLFLLMWLNFHNHGTSQKVHTPIISKGNLSKGKYGSCARPYIRIKYKGHKKQVVLNCNDRTEMYNSTDLTIAKGMLGFEVILGVELVYDF
ncbi:MAG TPA: hypothetical protein VFV31_02880 [Chitinophagaceae bacterium]|nr:hypothetical protein [Chitinophagaceae bacterium]